MRNRLLFSEIHRTFKNFSDSPRHLEINVLDKILKNVTVPNVSEHNALAIIVFPTPEAPCMSTPFHGFVKLANKCGCLKGKTTHSRSTSFACAFP